MGNYNRHHQLISQVHLYPIESHSPKQQNLKIALIDDNVHVIMTFRDDSISHTTLSEVNHNLYYFTTDLNDAYSHRADQVLLMIKYIST